MTNPIESLSPVPFTLMNEQFSVVFPQSTTVLRTQGTGPAITIGGSAAAVTATRSIPYHQTLAATSGTDASLLQSSAVHRINTASDPWGGFIFEAILHFPDASYDESGASTGSRIHVGLTSASIFNWMGTDYGRTSDSSVFFAREHVNGGALDVNWQLCTANQSAKTNTSTGMAFAINKLYKFRLECPLAGTAIAWTIENLTDKTKATGSETNTLPLAATNIQPAIGLRTINAVTRKVGFHRYMSQSLGLL